MVSYGLTQSAGHLNSNDKSKPSSATQTPSKSPAASIQIPSLNSSATKNKIPLIYSSSAGNSPLPLSLYSPSKTGSLPLQDTRNLNLSPSKSLEMVSVQVSKCQENFQALIQQK